MALHARPLSSRPLPGRAGATSDAVTGITSASIANPVSPGVPHAEPAIDVPDAPTARRSAKPSDAGRNAVDRPDPRPWYRREPWLASVLMAFLPVPIAAIPELPSDGRLAALVASGFFLLLGGALLLRQGVFRPTRPAGARPQR